jgi:hypothetical protein
VFLSLLSGVGPGIGGAEQEAPGRPVNHLTQAVFTPLTWTLAAVVLAVAVRLTRRHASPVPVLMVVAAAVNSLNEPLFDKVYHLYWYSPGQWSLFSTYGYPQPVWVMSAYVVYYCVPGLFIWNRLRSGASRQWAFKAVLVTAVWGAVFESVAIALGAFTYFGPNAFRVFNAYPLWLGLMEASHIVIWAMLLAFFTPVLTGARAALVPVAFAATFATVMYGAGGLGLAAINVGHPAKAWIYAAAMGSVVLAGAYVRTVGFLHRPEKEIGTVEAFLRQNVNTSTRSEKV